MARFAFRARDSHGQAVDGHREAVDAGALARELAAAGMVPISVEEEADEEGPEVNASPGWFQRKVTLDETILLSHQMASLTRAGVSVDRALRGLADSHRNPRLQAVLTDVSVTLESGVDVASALRRHPAGMAQSASFYEEEVDYQLKSLTDAIEPILVIAIGIMVLILALGVFLPLWDLSSVANR